MHLPFDWTVAPGLLNGGKDCFLVPAEILPTKSESASYVTLFCACRDRFQDRLSRSEAGYPLRRGYVLR
jgi:hypothetical protein